jgi:hypothetical protein
VSRYSSPADWFWMQHHDHPPTTAAWLQYMRSNQIKKMYYQSRKGVWTFHRPYRPFISPNIFPWGTCTTAYHDGWWFYLAREKAVRK